MVATLKQSKGMALILVVFVSAMLLPILGAGLFFSGLNLKSASNLKTGNAAFQVADSGIQHGLAAIPVGVGFAYSSQTEIVPSSSLPSLSEFSYSVQAINTAAGSKAILTSTALGPNGSKKIVIAYVGRGSYGLGAISLPGSTAATTETNFSGTSFSINGNDQCGSAPPVPGIAATDPALANEITNNTTSDGGLASNQMNLISGAGGTPSVTVISPLSMTVSDLADSYLALSHTDLPGGRYSSNETWGTQSSPRITRLTGNADIQGTIEGYGVLIVDGALEIAGNFTFHGLVIARGDIQVQITGNAGIYGSLVLGESITYDPQVELDVRGNATVRYDSCALAPADGWVPLPKAVKLLAWQENLSI